MTVRERLAQVACDTWWEICEEPTRWATTPPVKQATFRAMAAAALAAAREGRRSPEQIAEAMCVAFWDGHPAPWPWETLSKIKRGVFVQVARRVIAEARLLKAERGSSAETERAA